MTGSPFLLAAAPDVIHSIDSVDTLDRLEAALQHAALGLPIFPITGVVNGVCTCKRGPRCPLPGKHRMWPRAVLDATTNVSRIREWWSLWPWANLAIPTGNGFWALDIDAQPAGLV